jgi:thymidylate synthase
MHDGLEAVLERGDTIHPSKGECRELLGVHLELANPRARLSRSEARGRVFSALGELLWFLRGSNDLETIAYYLPRYKSYADEDRIYGGYGPRLLSFDGINQINGVVEILRRKPDSRQAVIQLFDHRDLSKHHSDIPCTCVLQFVLRASKLYLLVYMRSNDAYIGLPHDVFTFTMLQEIIASALGVDLGRYTHLVGSFHLYKTEYDSAARFISEGYFSRVDMPVMPQGDPWPAIEGLLEVEETLRSGADPLAVSMSSDLYWQDLGRLLGLCSLFKQKRFVDMETIRNDLSVRVYDALIMDKLEQQHK